MSPNKKTKNAKQIRHLNRANKQAIKRRRLRSALASFGVARLTDLHFIRPYYQSAFTKWLLEINDSKSYPTGPSPIRRRFWESLSKREYSSQEGQEVTKKYLNEVTASLEQSIKAYSLPCWLHVTRRLATVSVGRSANPSTIQHTRDSLDAAIQKWAALAPCSHIGISTVVATEKILSGELTRTNDRSAIQAVKAKPQLVLTAFTSQDLLAILTAEKLCYESWWSMAKLRGLGKGAKLSVSTGSTELAEERRTDSLQFLIRSYDQRAGKGLFRATGTGAVFSSEAKNSTILLPQLNTQGVTFSELNDLFSHYLRMPIRTTEGADTPNFIWVEFDLSAYYATHRHFSEPFRNTHGVSLESVIGVIASAAWWSISLWEAQPEQFMQSWQRAYDGPLLLSHCISVICNLVPQVLNFLNIPADQQSGSTERAIEFLTLRDNKRANIDIGYPGPHYVFLPYGHDRVFIDLAHAVSRLYHMFHGVELSDQNFKGDALESFTRRGASVLPTGKLKRTGDNGRQVDASFAVGAVLVICECRAVSRSIAVERGDPTALDKRKAVVQKTLRDIDEKARWLAQHPVGSNYDISMFSAILPVGITPFYEFIYSYDRYFWITRSLPRVLTPDELFAAIDDGEIEKHAERCFNLVKVPRLH